MPWQRAKTWHWYQQNRELITTNRGKNAPALPKQLDFLRSKGYRIEPYQEFYTVLRNAIVEFIFAFEDDERFRTAHDSYQQDKKNRTERLRAERTAEEFQIVEFDDDVPPSKETPQRPEQMDEFLRALEEMP